MIRHEQMEKHTLTLFFYVEAMYVSADFARELERENAALRDTVEDLRRENVGLLADKGRLDWMNSDESNGKELKWINDFRAAIDAARKEGGAS